MVHYLSPRGLEQYTGGGWGTRDVSQGPVALLLTLGAHAELRELLLMIMAAQNERGDWPQAFDFLERHRQPGSPAPTAMSSTGRCSPSASTWRRPGTAADRGAR